MSVTKVTHLVEIQKYITWTVHHYTLEYEL